MSNTSGMNVSSKHKLIHSLTSNGAVPLEEDPTTLHIYIYIYIRSAAKGSGLGTKIHTKRQEISGLALTPQQDVIHTGLSGSRGRPAVECGCFVQSGLETTRTSPKALPDKP